MMVQEHQPVPGASKTCSLSLAPPRRLKKGPKTGVLNINVFSHSEMMK